MTSIVARYNYTEEEAVRSVREVTRAVVPIMHRLPWFGALIFFGTLGYSLVIHRTLLDAVMPLVFGATFMALPWLTFRHVRKQFRQNPSRDKQITWIVTEDTLNNETDASKATFTWKMLIDARELPEGFLLFPQPRLAHWIPKHAFASAEDLDAFRGLIQRSGVKHSGGKLGPGEHSKPSVQFRLGAYSMMALAMFLMSGSMASLSDDWIYFVLGGLLPPVSALAVMLVGAIVFKEDRDPRTRTRVILWTGVIFFFAAVLLFSPKPREAWRRERTQRSAAANLVDQT